MAKGSIKDFQPTGISRRQFFSDDDLDAIIEAAGGLPPGEVEHRRAADDGVDLVTVRVPRRDALKERLESAARCWDVYAQYSNSPSAQQVAKNIEAILKTCDKLLNNLGLPNKSASGIDALNMLPEALRARFEQAAYHDSGANLLSDAIEGVYRLRDWSRAAESHAREAELKSSDKRHEGDQALDGLFESLARIWMEIFEKELATSVGGPLNANAGKAGGPLVRFLRACLSPLLSKETPTDEAIRNRVRRLRRSLVKSK